MQLFVTAHSAGAASQLRPAEGLQRPFACLLSLTCPARERTLNQSRAVMAAAALYLIIGLMVCFASSMEGNKILEDVKEQIRQIEQMIEFGKANLEAKQREVFEIMEGNTARVKCLRVITDLPLATVEYMEDYTANRNANVKRSFADMAAVVQELESQLEDMKERLKYFEHFHSEL
ncbi:hypothetical protein Q5P01_002306 [Channa striata]|uniref:Uncharacterized protein n=1 Tax=Channa striata TaxID=64152 RepID=A0AA88T621_CHASR|nr:hypothetical protein Q5P01_002306 [Channa striata]